MLPAPSQSASMILQRSASYEDLKDYFDLFLRKAKRRTSALVMTRPPTEAAQAKIYCRL